MFLPLADSSVLAKAKLHVVTMAGKPTVASEQAALRQADFDVTTEIDASYNGSFFLVTTPPETDGVYA